MTMSCCHLPLDRTHKQFSDIVSGSRNGKACLFDARKVKHGLDQLRQVLALLHNLLECSLTSRRVETEPRTLHLKEFGQMHSTCFYCLHFRIICMQFVGKRNSEYSLKLLSEPERHTDDTLDTISCGAARTV